MKLSSRKQLLKESELTLKSIKKSLNEATTKEKVEAKLKQLGIKKYTINSDMSVDVKGDVDISNTFNFKKSLKSIPVQFRNVSGNFYCQGNELISLKGAPQKVGGDFYCNDNQLTSLKGAPQSVGRGFRCHNNRLTSLEGAPRNVGWGFHCHNNQLTSLKGAPQNVGGNFNCSENKLTSLEGAPKKVGDVFDCRYNPKLPESQKDWAEENIRAQAVLADGRQGWRK